MQKGDIKISSKIENWLRVVKGVVDPRPVQRESCLAGGGGGRSWRRAGAGLSFALLEVVVCSRRDPGEGDL